MSDVKLVEAGDLVVGDIVYPKSLTFPAEVTEVSVREDGSVVVRSSGLDQGDDHVQLLAGDAVVPSSAPEEAPEEPVVDEEPEAVEEPEADSDDE